MRHKIFVYIIVFCVALVLQGHAVLAWTHGSSSGAVTGRVVQNGFSAVTTFTFKNFFKAWSAANSASFNGQNPAVVFNSTGFPTGTLSNNLGGQLFLPPDLYLSPVRFKWVGTMSGSGMFLGLSMTATSGGGFLSGTNFSGTDGDVTFNINPTTTSSSSNSIAISNETFTVGAGLSWSVGDRIVLAQTGSQTNYMIGTITSYSGTTLVVAVNSIFGSGTFSSWNIWAAPTSTNTFFWSGATFTNMSSIVLCRDQDFATVTSDPFYHQFTSVIQAENPQILRFMGVTLSAGNEQQSNPLWAYRKSVNQMSWAYAYSFPPGAYAGDASGTNAFTTGSYPDMPGTWTDKETFQFNVPVNTVTVSIASPARLSLPKSVVPGEAISLYTTGALPTGITASTQQTGQNVLDAAGCGCNTYYFALDSGTTNIRIAATPGGSPINTSGTQSGVHSMSPTTALAITGVADNGSNIPRLALQSTSGLSTNDIVEVNMGNVGAFKIAVIDSTHIDLSTSYPSGVALTFSAGGQVWSTTTGRSPLTGSQSYLTNTSINVASRGAKPVVGTNGLTLPPGNLRIATSTVTGVNTCVYDAVSDMVMCAPGGLYTMEMPIEIQVAAVNRLNKHLWYEFPADVSDATVTSTIQYIAANLNSNLKAYIAYSNETWNNSFTQYFYLWRYGISKNYAYGNSGEVQQNLTATGLRTLQIMQLAQTAWTGAGRSSASLPRILSLQAAGGSGATAIGGLFQTFLMNGNDLPAPNNAAPNRPIDNADVVTYANYWGAVLYNNQYVGTTLQYSALTTAAAQYASGVPANMATALSWVYGDVMGTNGTTPPTGTADFSVNSLISTGGTNEATAPNYEALFASYDAQRAGIGLAPLAMVAYEGGPDLIAPNSTQCAALGISSSCNDIATLLTAFKNDSRSATMIFNAQSAFVSPSFPHNKNGSFLQVEGPNEWSLLSGDFFSTPYQMFNGATNYNN